MRNLGSLFQRLLTEENKVTKRWKTFTDILAVIVTFTTTYSLILPAITVSNDQVEEVAGLYPDEADFMIMEDSSVKLYRYSVPEGGTAGSYSVYPDEANSEKATGTAEGEDYGTVTFEKLPDGCYI